MTKEEMWDELVQKCAGFTPNELVESRQFWRETSRERSDTIHVLNLTIAKQAQQLADVNEEFNKQSRYIEELADKINEEQAEVALLTKKLWRSDVIINDLKVECESLEQIIEKLKRKKPKRDLELLQTYCTALENRVSCVESRCDILERKCTP